MASATDILSALIALADDKIWATELALLQGGRRVDFWTLEPAASRGYRASAYEIKISRADFRRDSEEKQDGALRYSDRFWYVTPPALVLKAELPQWAGLMEWNGKTFAVKKKAPSRCKQTPDWEFVVSLMRNCGDQRRDIGLLKAQLAFYESRAQQQRDIDRMRSDFNMKRWIKRIHTPETPTDPG